MLRYDTGKVYHHLCGDQAVVQWAGAVWSSKSIPRHSFHSWLVVLDRNPTRDRLLSWGLQVSHLCLLCNVTSETRNHLYMDCPYSYDLWSRLATKCQLQPLRNGSDLLNQMIALPSPKQNKLLSLLAWKATMYWLWRERNQRLHANTFRSVDSLIKTIDLQKASQNQTLPFHQRCFNYGFGTVVVLLLPEFLRKLPLSQIDFQLGFIPLLIWDSNFHFGVSTMVLFNWDV